LPPPVGGWRSGHHGGGDANEGGVVGGQPSIRENRGVLKSGPDAVAACKRSLVHRPARHAVTVMYLLQRDVSVGKNLLHSARVRDRLVRVGLERLDKDSHAAPCYPCADERFGVAKAQQTRFDTHAAVDQVVTQLEDPVLALVGGGARWSCASR
jgi:hypothetical protein